MRIPLILAVMMLAGCGQAKPPEIAIHGAWARATNSADGPAAAYLTISNQGGEDRLLSVRSGQAASASLHSSGVRNGIMEMRPLPEGVAIAAHGDTLLSPAGTHIMLERVGPLHPGDRLQLSLHFEKSGDMVVPVSVVAPGSR